MQIIKLINLLQDLYDKEIEYKDVLGEPEIMIDSFKSNPGNTFSYLGISGDIEIQRTPDGVYSILTSKDNIWRELGGISL